MKKENESRISNTKEYLETYQPIFVVDESRCKECPLWETSFSFGTRRSGVYGRGSGKNGIYFIGEALGATEVRNGMPFVGEAGQLISRLCMEISLNEAECFFTNAVRCRPPENRTPSAEEMKVCSAHHRNKDLPHVPPKFVVLLGNAALKAVLNLTKISERRGIWYDGEYAGHQVKILPTFHPANILRKPALYDTVKADLIKVREALIESRTPGAPSFNELPKLNREYINSEDRFKEWMSILSSFPDLPIVCDLETTGLNQFEHTEYSVDKEGRVIEERVPRDEIVSCSLVFELEGEWYGLAFLTKPGVKSFQQGTRDQKGRPATAARCEYYSKEEWWWADLYDLTVHDALQKVLNRPIGLDFHNEDFDVKMWWAHGYITHCRIDTLDAHLMIDENSLHGLKFLVTRFLSQGGGYQQKIYDTVGDKGALGSAPAPMLLEYNLEDTYYTGVLERYRFTPQIQKEGTWDFFMNHAMPLRRALTRVSWRGLLLDKARVLEMSDRYRKEGIELDQQLFDLVGQKFNYNSSAQLINVLYGAPPQGLGLPILQRTEKNAPSTGKEVLAELAKIHPAPALIDKIRHKRKMLSTYLDGRSWPDSKGEVKHTGGLLRFLDDRNRLHCSFLTSGTISGRLAARDPSLLNIPRDPEIRMNFMAPEGWSFIDKDYSQAELVVLAYLAEDPGFIEAVSSQDMHQHVMDNLMKRATALMEKFAALNPKDLRNVAKSVNFRKAYRGGSEGLAEQLKLAAEETAQWYAEWDAAYPNILIWWQKMENKWRQDHMIEGIYGRKKHFPPALDRRSEAYYDRLSANFPCQNGVADTTNRALFMFEEEMQSMFGSHFNNVHACPGIVLAVHDNLIAEAPDELVEDINQILDYYMKLPLPKIGVQLKVDTHIVKRWGQDEFEKQQHAREEKIRIDEEMEKILR